MSRITTLNTLQNLRKLVQNAYTKRTISTSKKSASETVTVDSQTQTVSKKEDWVHYGFNRSDKTADRNVTHATFFVSVTLCLVGGTFYYSYLPDVTLRDWAQREAFLEIRRREAAGLPLVDANLIDPSKINLPSDEELGDAEIII